MKIFSLVLSVGLIVGVSACRDRNYFINSPTQPSYTQPTSPTQFTNKIEFRVTGNANSVRIRYSTERDGLVQTVTTLPFFTSFNTTSDNLFLSLDVTPISYPNQVQFPFLAAQIFANSDLFREATSSELYLNTLSVNGTWRR